MEIIQVVCVVIVGVESCIFISFQKTDEELWSTLAHVHLDHNVRKLDGQLSYYVKDSMFLLFFFFLFFFLFFLFSLFFLVMI